jgi:hypothetical protein
LKSEPNILGSLPDPGFGRPPGRSHHGPGGFSLKFLPAREQDGQKTHIAQGGRGPFGPDVRTSAALGFGPEMG